MHTPSFLPFVHVHLPSPHSTRRASSSPTTDIQNQTPVHTLQVLQIHHGCFRLNNRAVGEIFTAGEGEGSTIVVCARSSGSSSTTTSILHPLLVSLHLHPPPSPNPPLLPATSLFLLGTAVLASVTLKVTYWYVHSALPFGHDKYVFTPQC